ncbi:DUF1566 domain-containing protein [Vibrio nigripulchritudo]|uniref:Lcl domain-containing protein n=1 Tax=Vibrio nigripulchritudo TaxID=28173 RepID=UPI0003B1E84E|nr:DUF1566 domain-containing protein [Vibrio nigripulchritudo]CCN71266.1 hypothetical protein VIBNISFn118_320011 [Vibrio nigripulchritudo SFn118]
MYCAALVILAGCGGASDLPVSGTKGKKNSPPEAKNLQIKGEKVEGKILSASYKYFDKDGDQEDDSELIWYVGDSKVTSGTASANHTLLLTPNMVGKSVKFSITPKAKKGEVIGRTQHSSHTPSIAKKNVLPTVSNVVISGSYHVGSTLTVSYTFTAPDGSAEGNSLIQWYSNNEKISGATSKSYVLKSSDLGKQLHVTVTPFAASSSSLPGSKVTSAQSPTITANTPPVATNLNIMGSLHVGGTLTANYTFSDKEGDAESESTFQWFADDIAISDATTKTLTLTSQQLNKRIQFEITPISNSVSNPVGTKVRSSKSVAVSAAPNIAPIIKNLVVTGSPIVGVSLRASYTFFDQNGDREGSSKFQWFADDQLIRNATSKNYTISASDLGKKLHVEVTPVAISEKPDTGKKVVSSKTPVVKNSSNSAPTATNVTVSGLPVEGEILTSAYKYQDAEGDKEGQSRIQWFADDVAVSGATSSTFPLHPSYVGKRIHVTVTPVARTGVLVGSRSTSAKTSQVLPGTVPHPPYVQSVRQRNQGATLSWEAVNGAQKYTVYIAKHAHLTPKDGTYSSKQTTTTQSISLTGFINGQEMFAIVTASNMKGESVPSRVVSFTPESQGVLAENIAINDTGLVQFSDFPDWLYEDKNKPYSQRRGRGKDGIYSGQGFGKNLTPYDFLDKVPDAWQEQDAMHGRDAKARLSTLSKKGTGYAGFDFTKLDASGTALATQDKAWKSDGNSAESTQWRCAKDNVTKLVWEVKQPGDFQNSTLKFTWKNSNPSTNGGFKGYNSEQSCLSADDHNLTGHCNTEAYVAEANKNRLCGFDDWRLPTYLELMNVTMEGGKVIRTPLPGDITGKTGVEGTITWDGHDGQRIDKDIFPHSQAGQYWTSTPSVESPYYAITVSTDRGRYASETYKKNPKYIRLVRGNGQ